MTHNAVSSWAIVFQAFTHDSIYLLGTAVCVFRIIKELKIPAAEYPMRYPRRNVFITSSTVSSHSRPIPQINRRYSSLIYLWAQSLYTYSPIERHYAAVG